MNDYQHVKDSRKRLKERLVIVMGGGCALCGYDLCEEALEMHHINPEEKSFSIRTNANLATEKVFEEAKKCILVCANCHREIHAGLIDSSTLSSSYNEKEASKILEEINKKKGIIKNPQRYCSKCGKTITKYSETGLCSVCASEARRLANRPPREELKNLIRTLPFTKIAEKYGVTDNAIRKWCDAEKLPRTKKEINGYSNEEWEMI